MENALGDPQTIVLLGGTSEIGLAIVASRCQPDDAGTIVLACRDPDGRGGRGGGVARRPDLAVEVVRVRRHRHRPVTPTLMRRIADRHGDLDVVIDRVRRARRRRRASIDDPTAAAEVAARELHGTGRSRGGGCDTAVGPRATARSSCCRASPASGCARRTPSTASTKAGLDGFAQGLGDLIAAVGVHVLVVRPGFVHTKMTAGMKAAPLATTPERVATATVRRLRARSSGSCGCPARCAGSSRPCATSQPRSGAASRSAQRRVAGRADATPAGSCRIRAHPACVGANGPATRTETPPSGLVGANGPASRTERTHRDRSAACACISRGAGGR